MQSYGKPSVSYDWWAGNSGVAKRSGSFIAAHTAHAGLIMFWAGAFTLFELARYDALLPMGDQGLILLPHMASLGLGLGAGATIVNTEPYIAIAAFHLISSAVLGAAGIWHLLRAPKNLSEAEGRAEKFHFEWDDPKKLTFILGHHLIFLGLGAIAFVEWAQHHGIYDTAIGAVRKELRKNCREARWFGLKIKAVEAGGVEDLEGTVTFEATFGAGGQRNVMTEISLFQRRDGSLKKNWLYIKPL